jgi:hypothetical protein
MKSILRLLIPAAALLVQIQHLPAQVNQFPAELFSRAEKTLYEETSSSEDVRKFCEAIARLSDFAVLRSLSITKEKRDLMMLILANPRIETPEEAEKSGKPVIYIQGNIHAGEVEGKEASMQLIREICFGPKTSLLDNQVLIFCPNFNPDGNDKFSSTSRPSQDGSPKETGVRASGEGFDLNREGIKLEALEVKALVKNVLNTWDPDLFIDLHTDNGSWHGYALNYAPAFLTAGLSTTTSYVNDSILPAVEKSMLDRSGIPVFYHGYMNMRQGQQATFSTYSHLPRYLVNYMGLRNRMAILSETFAHDKFEKRILSNYLFLVSVLEFTNSHSMQINKICKEADAATVKAITENNANISKGVSYEIAAAQKPIQLLTRETTEYKDANGRNMRRPTGRLLWIDSVKHFDHFNPKILARVPSAYVFPAELQGVAARLEEHGIKVEKLAKKTRFDAEEFMITKFTRAQRSAYGNHNVVTVEGSFAAKNFSSDAGSYYVDMGQPLAWLIFYMLEPQSDDGLLFWNYFDDYLLPKGVEKGNVAYPVLKVIRRQ